MTLIHPPIASPVSVAGRDRDWRGLTRLLAAAMLALGVAMVLRDWHALASTAPDTDSVMRLLEVKRLLAGDGWYAGLFEPRLAPPGGYWTHWSRLVDLPIAGLLALARLFVSDSLATVIALALWPLLLLACMARLVHLIATRLAGPKAGVLALIGVMACQVGLQAFQPGNIDHHSVQVTLLLLVFACLVSLRAGAASGPLGGAALALLTATGLETLHVIVVALLWLTAMLWIAPSLGRRIAGFFWTFAAVSVLCFALDTPPERWSFTACDAMALNYLGAAVTGGLGMGLLAQARSRLSAKGFALALATTVAATLAVFAWLDPVCLCGPFARIDPALYPLWLDNVVELEPAWRALLRDTPAAFASFAFPLTALGLLAFALRSNPRDALAWLFAAALAAAVIVTALHLRGRLEASWLAIPIIAALAVRLLPHEGSLIRPLAIGVGLPLAFTAIPALVWSSPIPAEQAAARAGATCDDIAVYAPIDRLPPGLVLNEIDLGPNLLLRTHHSAMQAPYHRVGQGIVRAERIFDLPPGAAMEALRAARVGYVLTCGNLAYPARAARQPSDALARELASGASVAGLVPIPLGDGNPLRIWRVQAD